MTFESVRMTMNIVYTCPCNNNSHTYPSRVALNIHKKSKSHLAWLDAEELRELKIILTKKDNEIMMLRTQLDGFRKLANESMDGLESHALPNDTFKRFSQIPK
jgi:hypothetical protein